LPVGDAGQNRQKMADLVNELIERQRSGLQLRVVLQRADDSSGLKHLTQHARQLRDQRGFNESAGTGPVKALTTTRFSQNLFRNRPVVMGCRFTSEGDGQNGAIPEPVMGPEPLKAKRRASWLDGFRCQPRNLASAAPLGGVNNAITEEDGVVRSLPLMAQYRGSYYGHSTMFRRLLACPKCCAFSKMHFCPGPAPRSCAIPVVERVATHSLFAFGRGRNGSFRCFLRCAEKLSAGNLPEKIVFLGALQRGLICG
jgi:adenylate cyclase